MMASSKMSFFARPLLSCFRFVIGASSTIVEKFLLRIMVSITSGRSENALDASVLASQLNLFLVFIVPPD